MSSSLIEGKSQLPEILAPAGDSRSFLAALAAGCDAIYLGLKNFSARMEAENFGLQEVSRLTELAHKHKARVYIAMNTMLKQEELNQAGRLLKRVERQVHADGLIVQDLSFIQLAHQIGFKGGLFLSTLANVTHPEVLASLPSLGVSRVILPRELNLEEIRIMGENCPDQLDLELFVQGALCYCVSGRCYWSSYMGGKSGLRGRCVQPCRRIYTTGGRLIENQAQSRSKERQGRFFSCQDLSADVLTRKLLDIPHIISWKIEGRKKGPHYVYHCVTAYRILRDHPGDDKAAAEALKLIHTALGRPLTHARLIPDTILTPTDPSGITSSGALVGQIKKEGENYYLNPRFNLSAKDFLRIGTEEMPFHQTLSLPRGCTKGDSIKLLVQKTKRPPLGTPVFLIDRRDKDLGEKLKQLNQELTVIQGHPTLEAKLRLFLPAPVHSKRRPDMRVLAQIPKGRENRAGSRNMLGLWLSSRSSAISSTVARRVYWWLPPVIWPDESTKIGKIVQRLCLDGCRHFVLNAPWQRAFFPEILSEGFDLVAGPFCNLANALSLKFLADLGFRAAFISPELPRENILALPAVSPLPLGMIIAGSWPVGISRLGLLGIRENTPFASPRGEIFWSRKYGENIWIYPAWPLDLREKQDELLKAGYTFFATLNENTPANMRSNKRPGLFNWGEALL